MVATAGSSSCALPKAFDAQSLKVGLKIWAVEILHNAHMYMILYVPYISSSAHIFQANSKTIEIGLKKAALALERACRVSRLVTTAPSSLGWRLR